MENENAVYYFPPIRDFRDTGFVTHAFPNGSSVTVRVIPGKDACGFLVELVVKDDSGKEVCNFAMNRFSALCMAEGLIKTLMNQEELVENEYYNKNKLNDSRS